MLPKNIIRKEIIMINETTQNKGEAIGAIDPKEFSVAKQEAKSSTGSYIHTFKKPFVYQGKTYKELTFESDALLLMPLADYNKIRGAARSFLLKSE